MSSSIGEKRKMKILVVNDDGLNFEGLNILVRVAKNFGQVFVSVPYKHQSATSNSITIKSKINVYQDINPIEGSEKTILVDGTPTDCVRVAHKLYKDSFDLVLSGINDGPNLSTDILYSGTVGAAREAAILGIPAIALSAPRNYYENLENNLYLVLNEILSKNIQHEVDMLNVNFPQVAEPLGLKWTKQGKRIFFADFNHIIDESYKVVYSIVNYDEDSDVDSVAVDNNYIAITPLKVDQTDYEKLEKYSK